MKASDLLGPFGPDPTPDKMPAWIFGLVGTATTIGAVLGGLGVLRSQYHPSRVADAAVLAFGGLFVGFVVAFALCLTAAIVRR